MGIGMDEVRSIRRLIHEVLLEYELISNVKDVDIIDDITVDTKDNLTLKILAP